MPLHIFAQTTFGASVLCKVNNMHGAQVPQVAALGTLFSLLKLASSLFLSLFQGCRESMHVSLSFVACIYELHEYFLTQYKETSTPNQNGNNLYNLLSRITSKLNSHCHFHGA